MSLFTKSEATFIRQELKETEAALESINHHLKTYADSLWKECDPNDVNTKNAFEMLNHIRDKIRRNTKKSKKIAEINRKLKKV